MNTKFFSAAVLVMTVMMTACSNDDNVSEARRPAEVSNAKTVLVYIAGGNDLSRAVEPDLKEMKEGSINSWGFPRFIGP